VLRELVGDWYSGILTSDRAKVYDSYSLRRRQICWSHLLRDFQAMIDRGGPGQVIGEALLEHARVVFAWWHWVRDGTWTRSTFQSYVCAVRASFKMELEWDTQNTYPKTAATCRDLLAKEAALWTFIRIPEIAETNNTAERALRHTVQWRKTSYGTASGTGSRFVESLLTVWATCQQHQQNAFAYLTMCCRALFKNSPSRERTR
jgi:transposase